MYKGYIEPGDLTPPKKPKKKAVRESAIRKALDERVKAYGGETRAAAWLGRKHCPDVFVMFPEFPNAGLPATHCWVETKRPKKGATEGQKREHERMRNSGCLVIVITTLEELDEWLPAL